MNKIELVKSLLSRPVSFHRALVPVAGSVAGAVWLGQLMYWQDGRSKDPSGWVYKTQGEWEDETCLSADQQRQVRARLVSVGVLEEEKRGIPARLFYRINFENLVVLLAKKPASLNGCQLLPFATS